ncbi:uncharacterized protein [Engystomops pustulosus]|uniref:uncharacterized protein isoform X2 n=1 Tax=Engystomops pustulosus TaxID=76066 RepID=UPI003AFA2DDC
MDWYVAEFLKCVRYGEAVIPNAKKKKPTFCCPVCNVTVFSASTFESHLNGKKHRMKAPLSKSCEGTEYIQIYRHPYDRIVKKCELCGEELSDVATHLDSSSHILAFLKANYPNSFEYLQVKGLHTISDMVLKRVAVAEKELHEYEKLNDPELINRLLQSFSSTIHAAQASSSIEVVDSKSFTLQPGSRKEDTTTRSIEDCEPPRKMLKVEDPSSDVKSTTSDHIKENCGADQNRKDPCTSDKMQIKSEPQEFKKCKTESPMAHTGLENSNKITSNKDLYNFLKYFQISDETDIVFIQQIIDKFKSKVQEFFENARKEKEAQSIHDDENQETEKLKITSPAESILQQADSTTISKANDSNIFKSTSDQANGCKDFSSHPSNALCHSTMKLIEDKPSSLPSVLKSHHIKKEPDNDAAYEIPDKSMTKNDTNTCSGNAIEAKATDLGSYPSNALCHSTMKLIVKPSSLPSVLKSHHIKKEPDCEAADEKFDEKKSLTKTDTNACSVNTTEAKASDSGSYSSDVLCHNTKKPVVKPSTLTSVLKSHHNSVLHIKKEPESDAAEEEPDKSITKKDTNMCRGNTEEAKAIEQHKLVAAVHNPKIADLNCAPSSIKTYDPCSMTFGGKKNMHISEVVAEVEKFANTKPVLKGLDINRVVQILIQNRIEKNKEKEPQ